MDLDDDNQPEISETEDGNQDNHGFIYGYVTVIDRYPGVITLLITFITLGCGAIAFLTSGGPLFDEPRLGFQPRGTEIGNRDLSFINFINADWDVLSPIPEGNSVSRRDAHDDNLDALRGKRQEPAECPLPEASNPVLIFESSEEDATLFHAEHLKSICQQEESSIRSHSNFLQGCSRITNTTGSSTCCPSWSLGYAVALLNNKSSCSDITQPDVIATMDILQECAVFYTTGALFNRDTTNQRNIPSQCLRGDLVFHIFHFFTPSGFAENIGNGRAYLPFSLSFSPFNCFRNPCDSIYTDNLQDTGALNDGTTKVVAMNLEIKVIIFDELLVADFKFIILGMLFTALIIWIYTGSLFIMAGSLLNMAFSVIMAFFIYHVILRIPYFLFPNISAIILVVGIGADDTFVYVDLWKAAKGKFGGEKRRIHALQEATRHASLTLFVTTLTTSTALYTTSSTNVTAAKCYAVFGGTALICNFILTVTWLPAIIVLHDKYFDFDSSALAADGHSVSPKTRLRSLGKFFNNIRHSKILSGIFENVLPKVIYKLRYLWIVGFLLLGIAGFIFTFVYPRLELTEGSEFQLFKADLPIERFDQEYGQNLDYIRSTGSPFPLLFIWGVLPTREPNLWNPNDYGQLELDDQFQFGDAASQKWLSDFCVDLEQQWFYGNETGFCFIDSFRDWMGRPCLNVTNSLCCEQVVFPFSEEMFHQCSKEYALSICRSTQCSSATPGLRFDQNGSINALYLSLTSSVRFSTQFSPVDEFWKAFSSWSATQISNAPPGMASGWCFSINTEQLSHYDLQAGIPRSTLFTMGLALGSAAVVLLLTTFNIHITLFAIVTILFTVVSTIGSLVWLGWELNLFESLSFTLAVGLSVDFSIHFGVAYGVAPGKDRKSRTMFVINTLGSAITAAALSTFAAGAGMVFAVVINYNQIGVFLMVVMATSWLFALFFFLPLCFTFGPNGDSGRLLVLFRRCCKRSTQQQSELMAGMGNPAFNS